MEKSGQKRKGFMRRLYRAATARSAGRAKSKPSNSPAPVDLATETNGGHLGVTSEMRSASLPKKSAPAPAVVQKQASSAHGGYRDGNGEMRGGYGGGDENVDVKAATYILWVRERLKKERSMDQKLYSQNSEIRVQNIP